MSFFIQKKNMYLHQYLFLNFLCSTIISIIFFSLNKYSLYKISVDLIFFKTHQLNSYLLCTFMYIIIIMVQQQVLLVLPLYQLESFIEFYVLFLLFLNIINRFFRFIIFLLLYYLK